MFLCGRKFVYEIIILRYASIIINTGFFDPNVEVYYFLYFSDFII